MAHERGHPRAEPQLWPLVAMSAILAVQVVLMQVALNRLIWGMYLSVYAPAAATLGLSLIAWLLYRAVDEDRR